MKTIRRVGIASAFKIGAILSALTWAVFGLIWLIPFALMSSMIGVAGSSSAQDTSGAFGAMAGLGVAMICVFYLGGIVLNAIVGGISCAIYAALYNVVAGWVGGIEVELEDINN